MLTFLLEKNHWKFHLQENKHEDVNTKILVASQKVHVKYK